MLNTYSENKNKLSSVIKDVEQIATSKSSKEMLALVDNKLKENIFTLVVVGQFKRGKTTFINTLLGQDILPTAIIPLTSIITIIKYGEQIKSVVFFDNGKQQEISIKDIQLYATEKHNPKNEKKVDRVEILYPSPFLKNGVQIVDTPGIASIHEHNTKTTYQYLPQADAAIFLVSVDPPLTQAELLFLQDLKKSVHKIFFIQNKIDIVGEKDRDEALEFTKNTIQERAGFDDMIIYPLSAKTKIGLPAFEKELEKFLLEEKGNVLLHSSAEKIKNSINEELLLAELAEKSLNTPLRELENKLADFKSFLADINQECLDSQRLLAEEVRELQKDLLGADLEVLKEEKTSQLISEVEKLSASHGKDSNKKFIDLLDNFLAEQIRKIFAEWRAGEENKLKQNLEKIISRFASRINNIFERILASSSKLFGISVKQIKIQETLPAEIEFRFETKDEDDLLGMTLDTIKKALPKVIAHKVITKEAKERADMLVDRHCGKLHYDFSQRMEKLVQDYRTLFGNSVENMQKEILRALEVGLAAKEKTEAEVLSQRAELKNRIEKLKNSRNSI